MVKKISNYKLPHKLDRKGQQDAFDVIFDWYFNSPKQYMILSAPTGLGKTSLVASMSKYVKVLALVRTKVLQDAVYEGYGFDLIKGKRNYPCYYSPETHQADVCGIPDDIDDAVRRSVCQDGDCEYYKQYRKISVSHRVSTTYAKFTTDLSLNYNNPSLYVLDEAHELSDIVIERAGINYNVMTHPFLKGFGDLPDSESIEVDIALDMMRDMYTVGVSNYPVAKKSHKDMTDKEFISHRRRVKSHVRFLENINRAGKLILGAVDQKLWHFSVKDNTFSARPLTAANYFKHIIDTNGRKTLLMSATISPVMADMLGIEDNYLFYEAQQQYPPMMRRIYDLGQPGMGKTAVEETPSLYSMQAVKINNIIKLRPDVSSVILVSSKAKAFQLFNKLRDFDNDVFMPPIDLGTDRQLMAWDSYRKPGAVCISYNFWEGVSLDKDNMLFIASIKYPDLGNPFEMARYKLSKDIFNYRAAVYVVQASGRIQRGDIDHYRPIGRRGNLVGKMVFIVDGNWKRIQKYAPGDFMERIVRW